MKKILLIDDDPISLRVLTNYLQASPYECQTAEDGLQAWELLQQHPTAFALIISDRIMPGLHGLQLLAKMQTHAELCKIPLVLLTGEAEKAEQIEAIKAGVVDFLYKPVDQQLLLTFLKRILK